MATPVTRMQRAEFRSRRESGQGLLPRKQRMANYNLLQICFADGSLWAAAFEPYALGPLPKILDSSPCLGTSAASAWAAGWSGAT